jgi:hypothetical protein
MKIPKQTFTAAFAQLAFKPVNCRTVGHIAELIRRKLVPG